MAVHEGDVEDVRRDNNVMNAGGESAMTSPPRQESTPARHDYAWELTETINRELGRRGRSEAAIVSGIRQRTQLYENAFVQAKQDAIDAVARSALPAERLARQDETLRRADVEVVPPEMIGKLAALDARQYGKLRDSQLRAEAALAMAETARLSVAYHAALAAKAPEVSAAVRIAMATSEKPPEISAASAPSDRSAVPRNQAVSDAWREPTMTLDRGALERVARNRARDVEAIAKQQGWNGIEQVIKKQQPQRDAQVEEQRTASNSAEGRQPKAMATRAPGTNQVVSDEVFTASRDEGKPIVPVEIESKYLRVGAKFYHPKSTHVVAFEDKGNKLQTQSNSEQIAEAMVTIARARGWDEIKISGSEAFRKLVWLEAAAHGMQVKGYSPNAVDKAELAKRNGHLDADRSAPASKVRERTSQPDAVQLSKVGASITDKTEKADIAGDRQPAIADRRRAQAFAQKVPAEAIMDHPELAGSYAAMVSMKKKAAADGLSPQQRAVVIARVEANLVNSIERGELPKVKVREQVEVRHQRKADRKVTR